MNFFNISYNPFIFFFAPTSLLQISLILVATVQFINLECQQIYNLKFVRGANVFDNLGSEIEKICRFVTKKCFQKQNSVRIYLNLFIYPPVHSTSWIFTTSWKLNKKMNEKLQRSSFIYLSFFLLI